MKKETKTKETKIEAVKASKAVKKASEVKKPVAKASKPKVSADKAPKAAKVAEVKPAVAEVKQEVAPSAPAKPVKAVKEPKAKTTKSTKTTTKNSEYPAGLVFTKRHIWAQPNTDDNTALVGISDFLADELGNIDDIDVPSVGDEVEMESICIHIHVGNHVRHCRCPLTGRVIEVNQDIIDDPSQIYMDYFNSWLFKMEYDDPAELDVLMDGAQYSKYLDEL